MFRLIFKIHEVHLKLRGDVEIQVLIKKGQESFVIPCKAKLLGGIATLNAHTEFYISKETPIFEVIVMILHNSGKKFAGTCEVDLADW